MLLAIELKPFTSSLSCLNPQCTNLLVALGNHCAFKFGKC